jgi:hypothetical protein
LINEPSRDKEVEKGTDLLLVGSADHGGVSAMACAEGIVDVHITQRAQRSSEKQSQKSERKISKKYLNALI